MGKTGRVPAGGGGVGVEVGEEEAYGIEARGAKPGVSGEEIDGFDGKVKRGCCRWERGCVVYGVRVNIDVGGFGICKARGVDCG